MTTATIAKCFKTFRCCFKTYLCIGLGLGWVVEDDLTDDVLKKSLSSKWLQGLGFLQVLPLFRFYSSSGQLETLIFKQTEARA